MRLIARFLIGAVTALLAWLLASPGGAPERWAMTVARAMAVELDRAFGAPAQGALWALATAVLLAVATASHFARAGDVVTMPFVAVSAALASFTSRLLVSEESAVRALLQEPGWSLGEAWMDNALAWTFTGALVLAMLSAATPRPAKKSH